MKEGFHSSPLLLFFLFFLLFSSSTLCTARNISPYKGLVEVSNGGPVMTMELEDTHDFTTLMGEEICGGGEEEECLKRRVMSEAHLDYIYTQHHKP